MRKLTKEEFIEKYYTKFPDFTYTFENVIYINNSTHINVTCKEHNDFSITPANLLRGKGCKQCAINKNAESKKETARLKFFKEAKKLYGGKYDYSNSIYVNSKTPIDIYCNTCKKIFSKLPLKHIGAQQQGCYYCSKSNPNKTTEEFIDEAKLVYGENTYDYSLVDYQKNDSNVKIICKQHNIFLQTPSSHLRGSGCPSCAKGGFDPKKPGMLHYFKIQHQDTNEWLFKVGITNKTTRLRYSKEDLSKIVILMEVQYDIGQLAANEELRIKRKYKEFLYKGKTPFTNGTGTTEVFVKDILGYDNE
jgi:hypothetical protein